SVPLIEPEDVALSVDPLRNLATSSLITRVQDRYSAIADVEPASAGNSSARFLGSEVPVHQYIATADHDGSTTDVVVYVAQTRHDGEVVTAVGVAPRGTLDPAMIRTLITGTRR
ncbi:MAG: DUF6517 family protein, partial [Halobacteriales archaeon]|nr:DUF6517 family protein [Halobacteriales archaeon]